MMLDSPPIMPLAVRESKYRETYADNLLKMSQELTVQAGLKGSYAGVSGIVNSKFHHTEQRSEKRHFLKISYDISGKILEVGGDREKLKQLLSADFRRALGTSDPVELFDEYGTHICRKIKIGGRAEYFCQSSATSKMTADEFKVAAKIKYDSLGGVLGEDESPGGSIGGSTSVESKAKALAKDVQGNNSIDTIGGSAKSAVKIKDREGWANWAKAAEQLPGLLGFQSDGLLPIWELTDTSARRTAFYDAYKPVLRAAR